MARRPNVQSDRDDWGDVLNEYLAVSLGEDGAIREEAVAPAVASALADDDTPAQAAAAAAVTAVDAEIAGRDLIEWGEFRGPVPSLVLTPAGSRTPAGPITPTFSGTVPVVAGEYGDAWRVGGDNGTAYTYMSVPNTEGWFDGASEGTILLRARYSGAPVNVAAGYLFGIANASSGEFLNIGRMDTNSTQFGDAASAIASYPSGAFFDYIIRWDGSIVRLQVDDGALVSRSYTTPPKSDTAADFRFPLIFGTDAHAEVDIEAFVAFDTELSDTVLAALRDAEAGLTWGAIRKSTDDAGVIADAVDAARAGMVTWAEMPGTIPTLLLTPEDSRTPDGPIDPTLTGNVTVEPGQYGSAWRVGEADGSSYTRLSVQNTLGFLSGEAGTIVIRARDNDAVSGSTQYLGGVPEGGTGTFLNLGGRGTTGTRVGDATFSDPDYPTATWFQWAVRWDATTARVDVIGVGSASSAKTTEPHHAETATLQFPMAFGTNPAFDLSIEGVVVYDTWLSDDDLDYVTGLTTAWTWRNVIPSMAEAGAAIPPGGATGQALVKASTDDFDMEWATVSGGGSASHAHGRRAIAFGDSITAGSTGAEAGGYLHAKSWYTWMLHYSEGRFEHVRNAATPGDTLQGMQARLDTDVLAYEHDVVFFMAGANNVGTLAPSDAAVIYEDIVTRIQAAGKTVILCTLTPRDGTGATSIDTDKYSAVVRRIGAKYGLQVLDNTTPLIDPATGDFAAGMASDGLHPTIEGAVALGKAAARQLETYPPTFLANLATSATDHANLLTNGVFLGDADTDGVADGWTLSGPSGTIVPTLEPGTDGVVGNWQVIDKTVAGFKVLYQEIASGWSVGDRLRISGRVAYEHGADAGLEVGLRYTGGTPSRLAPIYAVTTDLEPGVFNMTGVVPSGTTAVSVQVDIGGGAGTGRARVAQISVINETALGIA